MVEKRLDAKWYGFLKPFEYWTARQMDAILFTYVLLQYSNYREKIYLLRIQQ